MAHEKHTFYLQPKSTLLTHINQLAIIFVLDVLNPGMRRHANTTLSLELEFKGSSGFNKGRNLFEGVTSNEASTAAAAASTSASNI